MNESNTTFRFSTILDAIYHAKANSFAVVVAATQDGETLGDFFESPEFKKGFFLSTKYPLIQRTPGTGIIAIRVTHDFRSENDKIADFCIFENSKESIRYFTNELEELEAFQRHYHIDTAESEPHYVIKELDKFVVIVDGIGKFNDLISNPIEASYFYRDEAERVAVGLSPYRGTPCKAVKLEDALAYRAHTLHSLILTIRTTY